MEKGEIFEIFLTWTIELVSVIVTISQSIATFMSLNTFPITKPMSRQVACYRQVAKIRKAMQIRLNKVKKKSTFRQALVFVTGISAVGITVAVAPDVNATTVIASPFSIGIAC